jgi:hypothetical protein
MGNKVGMVRLLLARGAGLSDASTDGQEMTPWRSSSPQITLMLLKSASGTTRYQPATPVEHADGEGEKEKEAEEDTAGEASGEDDTISAAKQRTAQLELDEIGDEISQLEIEMQQEEKKERERKEAEAKENHANHQKASDSEKGGDKALDGRDR